MTKTNWQLDPTHSELQFKVKHLMITTVTGSFNEFDIKATTPDDDFTKAEVEASINLSSIDTGNSQRDEHLKSNDFFSAEEFPRMTFAGRSITPNGQAGEMELKGDLTIRNTTREISLKLLFAGIAKDPYGNVKSGFSLEGALNRKDFGLDWNVPVESGLLVGEQVRILGEIQLVKVS